MSTLPKAFLTPEQYLEIERTAEFRSEYYNGEMFAMSGGTRWHDWINTRLQFLVTQHLEGKRCDVNSTNMRILVQPAGLFTYPDLSVTCGEPEFREGDVDTLVNPTVIFEILSPSTELYDRSKKARMYREMPSLRELVLISQDELSVELFRKQPGGEWTFLSTSGIEGAIELKSIEYTLSLRDLYRTALSHDDTGRFGAAAGA